MRVNILVREIFPFTPEKVWTIAEHVHEDDEKLDPEPSRGVRSCACTWICVHTQVCFKYVPGVFREEGGGDGCTPVVKSYEQREEAEEDSSGAPTTARRPKYLIYNQ